MSGFSAPITHSQNEYNRPIYNPEEFKAGIVYDIVYKKNYRGQKTFKGVLARPQLHRQNAANPNNPYSYNPFYDFVEVSISPVLGNKNNYTCHYGNIVSFKHSEFVSAYVDSYATYNANCKEDDRVLPMEIETAFGMLPSNSNNNYLGEILSDEYGQLPDKYGNYSFDYLQRHDGMDDLLGGKRRRRFSRKTSKKQRKSRKQKKRG